MEEKEYKSPEEKMWGIAKIVIACFVVVILVFSSVTFVTAGKRKVVSTFGKPGRTMNEGLNFKLPFPIQSTKTFDVKVQKWGAVADSVTRDLQDVKTEGVLNYHLTPGELKLLLQEVGVDYKARIIVPAFQEAVRAVMARYNAEEMTSERPRVREGIKLLLKEKLEPYHVYVDDFHIVNFQFSESFDRAIEEKQVAQQDMLKAEYELKKAEIQAQEIIVEAEAKARAISVEGAAIRANPEIIDLRIAERWTGKLPDVVGGIIPMLNIDGFTGSK